MKCLIVYEFVQVLTKLLLQVSVMQEELEAIQPHLTAASKEVDKSVTLVEKDLSEVSELEKIVKNEDAVVSEKSKQADIIRQDCQEELAEVELKFINRFKFISRQRARNS